MAVETTIQQIQENPQIERYRLDLLDNVSRFIDDNLTYMTPPPIMPPSYQVAGLTPLQQQAAAQVQSGIGSYKPYMREGLDAVRRAEKYTEDYGFGGLTEALGATREGQLALSRAAELAANQRARPYAYQDAALGALRGTNYQYNPETVGSYMNPYTDAVVNQVMRDIGRQGDIQRNQLEAQAAAQGAFGGSRQAIAEQELNRNIMEQQAKTAGQLRMGGYQQAQQQAQQAFEAAQQRQQQQAQQVGQLGVQFGQLGQADVAQLANMGQISSQMGQGLGSLAQTGGQLGGQLAQTGLQQAGLGQLGQQLNLNDVKALEAMGARDQALQQTILDAQRQNNMQIYQMPYQQYSFLSDIYKGTPSSQQVTQTTQTQDPSTFQQVAGLGIAGLSAAAGAKNLGMF